MSHCYTELLDYYCKLMSCHLLMWTTTLPGLNLVWEVYEDKNNVPSQILFPDGKKWMKSYSILCFLCFCSLGFSSYCLLKEFIFLYCNVTKDVLFLWSLPIVNWVQALPADWVSMVFQLRAATSSPKAALCFQPCHHQPSGGGWSTQRYLGLLYCNSKCQGEDLLWHC